MPSDDLLKPVRIDIPFPTWKKKQTPSQHKKWNVIHVDIPKVRGNDQIEKLTESKEWEVAVRLNTSKTSSKNISKDSIDTDDKKTFKFLKAGSRTGNLNISYPVLVKKAKPKQLKTTSNTKESHKEHDLLRKEN